MPHTESSAPSLSCIVRLMELARAAWDGDAQAAQQLRLAGELLDFAGGAPALCAAQGVAHDWQLQAEEGRALAAGRDLAGHIGSYWEHIPSWVAL